MWYNQNHENSSLNNAYSLWIRNHDSLSLHCIQIHKKYSQIWIPKRIVPIAINLSRYIFLRRERLWVHLVRAYILACIVLFEVDLTHVDFALKSSRTFCVLWDSHTYSRRLRRFRDFQISPCWAIVNCRCAITNEVIQLIGTCRQECIITLVVYVAICVWWRFCETS